jgi:predicted ATPase/class 3 adenylate cyclase
MSKTPADEVTLLFTDVQGSTRKWEEFGAGFGRALQLHNEIVRSSILRCNGTEIKTAGDGFMVAFTNPEDAVQCAVSIHTELQNASDTPGAVAAVGGIYVRVGIHRGPAALRDGDYFGPTVNRASRVCDAGHGGMTLVTEAVRNACPPKPLTGFEFVDLGLHKLKDLGQEERLFLLRSQQYQGATPPTLRTLSAVPHNFPAQITNFVGRRAETAELSRMLQMRTHRLITITGPGGTGKTRLAMQVAADRLQDFPDGIWLIDLASTNDPAAVSPTIASALGIEMSAHRSPLESIAERLRSLRALLLLDNFEQVAEAAGTVTSLLQECPDLLCIVTSRELLRISGEREYALAPLSAPRERSGYEEIAASESVELFLDRCRLAKPDFELTSHNAGHIAGICRRLDGIPLALELAAARMRALSPQAMAQRLSVSLELVSGTQRDAPARQRTLRAAIDWSYDLLTDAERVFFAQLSAFDGGFDLEAAETVTQNPDALELILSLREKSLLRTEELGGEMRFGMLATLRSYAQERLSETDVDGELRRRHSRYYLGLAENWSPRLDGARSDVKGAMHTFGLEIANMRAAMDFCIAAQDKEGTAAWGRALARYLLAKNQLEECRKRLSLAVESAAAAQDTKAEALLNLQLGRTAFHMGRLEESEQRYRNALEISTRLGDVQRIPPPLINLGTVEWARGNLAAAKQLWETALATARNNNQPVYIARLLDDLGLLAAQLGDLDSSEAYYTEAMQLAKSNNDEVGMAFVLFNSAETLRRTGAAEEYSARLADAETRFRALGHRMGIAMCAIRQARRLTEQGACRAAEEAAQQGIEAAREDGDLRWQMYGELAMAELSLVQGSIGQAAASLERSNSLNAEVGDRRHQGEILMLLARALLHTGDRSTAARVMTAAEVMLRPVCPPDADAARAEIYSLLPNGTGIPEPWEGGIEELLQALGGRFKQA